MKNIATFRTVRVLGLAYAAAVGLALGPLTGGPIAIAAMVAVGVLAVLGASREGVRALLRALAGIHLLIALLAIRIAMSRYFDSQQIGYEGGPLLHFYASYLGINVFLPGLVIALFPTRNPIENENLPIGYEHAGSGRRQLAPADRVALVVAMTLGIPTFMMGGVPLTIIWLPILFTGYWIVRILRTRRTPPPEAQRRMRLSPHMQKPGQSKNYWTVNNSEYEDPDLYDQD